MRLIKWDEILKQGNAKRYIIFICTFTLMYSILVTSLINKKYSFKEGDIPKVNIKAPREIKDEVKTEEKIDQLVSKVETKYSEKKEVKLNTIIEVNSLFANIVQAKSEDGTEAEKIKKLKQSTSINIKDESYIYLLGASKEEIKAIQDLVIDSISQLFDSSIKDNADDIRLAKERVTSLVSKSEVSLSKASKNIAAEVCTSEVKPNFYIDDKLTQDAKNEIRKKVPDEIIKKDQIIVKEGEPISKYQLGILSSLGLIDNGKFQWNIHMSLAALVLLILILQWIYVNRNHKDIYNDLGKLLLINILNCIALILARSLNVVPFLIPLASVPMLLSLLINDKVALTISVMNCVLISGAVGFNLEITLLALMNSVMGAVILKKMQQRNDIIYSSLYIAAANVVLSFSIGFLLSNDVGSVLKKTAFVLIGSCLSAVVTIGLLPFLESSFDIVTTIKLLELSNPNSPLLKKLLMEAPGTYHHSILVANLAEVAAEEVGGNPVLARVSAYYHDIGKIKRPYFFKENQLGNDNPHNKITPNLSTLIITSHVRDGVELAKEYNVPKVIRDIIEQHHGDSLVSYFYITMKNSCENLEEVNEEDFRYQGPIPFSKEAGIIMLADSVEAAVRSINEPTQKKIEDMVSSIIKGRLNDGQLDNCDLTLKDLDKIKKAFLKVLSGIYHERIEYPTDKWVENTKEI